MEKQNVKIIVATHKKYQMPSDEIYLPLHVGAAGKKDAFGEKLDLGYQKDNTGDNISSLNSNFCELTGLYWAWKNLDCDFVGLAHYRRHFTVASHFTTCRCRTEKDRLACVLSATQAENLVSKYAIIVPRKRCYFIENLYSHYAHTNMGGGNQLDITRMIISNKFPEYVPFFDSTMKHRSGYMFNMYIMKKTLSDSYCEWLFEILNDLYKRIPTEQMSSFESRYVGRVSELLFNVWLAFQVSHNHYPLKEIGYLSIEKTNLAKKAGTFLAAKFLGVKYHESF